MHYHAAKNIHYSYSLEYFHICPVEGQAFYERGRQEKYFADDSRLR